MEKLTSFLKYLPVFFGALAATTALFPMSSEMLNFVSAPSLDRGWCRYFPTLFGMGVIVAIFLWTANNQQRKSASKGEKVLIGVAVGGAMVALFVLYWLGAKHIVQVEHGNDRTIYYFLQGDPEHLTAPYKADWDEGHNFSFQNYLKTLGYTPHADGEVFDRSYIARFRVIFVITYTALFVGLTVFFSMLAALTYRANEYDARIAAKRKSPSSHEGPASATISKETSGH